MNEARRPAWTKTAAVTVLLGWLLLLLGYERLSESPSLFSGWSYDLLQLVLPARADTNTVIVYMDEESTRGANSKGREWDRAIHARFLNRLTKDQPRVVVFDVVFGETNEPASDAALAEAIQRNGHVVLAGGRDKIQGVIGSAIFPPQEQFETSASGWGTAKMRVGMDSVARCDDPGTDQQAGLAWTAAKVSGALPAAAEAQRFGSRWLNYYGSSRPFEERSMNYINATNAAPGFFRDKAVFIGGKPETLTLAEMTDVFRTPFFERSPGVDLVAIAYSNLIQNDWLRRAGLPGELAILLGSGMAAGYGWRRLRFKWAFYLSLLAAALVVAASIALVLAYHYWFSWLIIVVAQLPCALVLRVLAERLSEDKQPARSEMEAVTTASPVPAAASAAMTGQVAIPDHTLLRCIGEGAYGQVWLARNAIGLHHAVKVLYRNRFSTETPYVRALRGIQKFMPISRSHAGFVHILHVGHNEQAGYFFYIMEAGDDQMAGQEFEPAAYSAKTLSSELRLREMIPPRECLELLLALTEAVDELHRHQLIHRDIKPSNIIFVHGRPKLADIDLVTDLSVEGEVSRIGTEGYMAPEGPGTAAADVFSLGRILYVALSGKPPDQSPELPTRISMHPECGLFLELNQIACKACETDLSRRYASGAAMRADLVAVSQRLGAAKET